jgi:hypothetical protein
MTTNPFPRGVTLTRSPLGGYSVEWNGSVRGTQEGDPGNQLGRFTQDEAVRQIAIAAGWPGTPGGPA